MFYKTIHIKKDNQLKEDIIRLGDARFMSRVARAAGISQPRISTIINHNSPQNPIEEATYKKIRKAVDKVLSETLDKDNS